jgi:branched-chain amino acid transport system substrate-binding protein
MKLFKLAILVVILLSIISCKKDKDETPFFPAEIALVINDLTASFDSLNNSISTGVNQFEASGLEGTAMRAKLLELFNGASFSTEFVYTSPEGIMEIIEPEEYYSYEGFDISSQPHVVKAFQTRQPVLSDAFMVVEGYQAAVTIHPMVRDNQLIGAISAVIMPETVLGRIIMPYLENMDFEMWVMEKSGLTLWDQDEEEIGLNLFTDPLYQDFPELLLAAQAIADGESGETSYSFFQAGMEQIVTKKTYWDTFYMQGNEWKIIWVKPE